MSITFICILLLFLIGIVLFVMLLIHGRSTVNIGKTRMLPLYITFMTFFGLLFFSAYNEYMLNKDIARLQHMNDSLSSNDQNNTDKLLSEPGGKAQVIDSLKKRTIELENNLKQVKKRGVIVGSGNVAPIIEETHNNISKVEKEISKVSFYNEVIDSLDFVKNLSKGFKFSGETAYFVFYPPKDIQGAYLDFSLKFVNDNIISKVAVIYIEVEQIKPDGKHYYIASSFYKPQSGMNNFIIPNNLKKKGTSMMVGFFWKSEFGIVDTPRYEKVTFVANPA